MAALKRLALQIRRVFDAVKSHATIQGSPRTIGPKEIYCQGLRTDRRGILKQARRAKEAIWPRRLLLLPQDMKRIFGILMAATWLARPSMAQNRPESQWPYKVEVFANIAHGRFYHGDDLWGKGLDYGGGVGFRPFAGKLRGLGLEVQAVRLSKSEELSATVSRSLKSHLIVANVLYHFFSNTKTQPYVFGGLGHVNADYTYRCVDCVFDQDPVTGELVSRGVTESRSKGSKLGVSLGAGVKIAVHRHLSIRPELLVVDTTPGSGFNWAWVRLQIGLGAQF